MTTSNSQLQQRVEALEGEVNLLKSEITNSVSSDDLPAIIKKVIDDNPKALKDAKNDPQTIHFLIGQVMKVTKGRANHSEVKKLIEDVL